MNFVKHTVQVKIIALVMIIFTTLLSGKTNQLSTTLPAYHNKISDISYAVGSDDQHALTFALQQEPICMYTPLQYQDLHEMSLRKTYFLPRTTCADAHTRYFYDDVKKSLQPLGIDVHFKEINDIHYGLQMVFTIASESKYDVVKIVDTDKKLIHFNFVAKI